MPRSFGPAREKLRDSGQPPSAVHNKCSGKHSGMLAVAEALGVPTARYVDRDHPVQQEVRSGIETVLHEPLNTDRCGTDGLFHPHLGPRRFACSPPASPAWRRARGCRRTWAAGAQRILDAATSHPELVGGTGSLDTEVMRAFGGRLMQKGGAEGVQCGVVRDKGWGYALKVDDGNMAASHAMVATLLLAIADPDDAEQHVLKRFAVQVLRNVRGLDVGLIKATAAMLPKINWTVLSATVTFG